MWEELLAASKYFGTFGGFGILSLPIALVMLRIVHRSPLVQDAIAINVRLETEISRLSKENETCWSRVDALRDRVSELEKSMREKEARIWTLEQASLSRKEN